MAASDPRELQAILGGIRGAGRGHDREGRVGMLLDFAEAVLAGREPDRAALLFVAGGLASWLREGGSLTRDYWRTAGPQGSTHTEAVIARRLAEGSSRRATAPEGCGTMRPSSTARGTTT